MRIFKEARISARRANLQRGFTLIELAIVILIVGLLIGGIVEALKIYEKRNYLDLTNSRIDTVRKSLQAYWDNNGVLPCVANPSLAPSHPLYGKSIDCTKDDPPLTLSNLMIPQTPTVRTIVNSVRGALPKNDPHYLDKPHQIVRIGAVPARTLGLSDDYMIEPHGRLLIYAVTESLTLPSSDPAKGAIDVRDPVSGASLLGTPESIPFPGSALYIVISPGRDGMGAWNRDGHRVSPCGGVTKDVENCNGDTIFLIGMDGYSEKE